MKLSSAYGFNLTTPTPLVPREVASGVVGMVTVLPGANPPAGTVTVRAGPPGERAGAALPFETCEPVGVPAVNKRVSALPHSLWNVVCTFPFTWITMVPGVGFASAPGSAGA